MSTGDVVLPAPTGRYRVGRTAFDWVDRDREEVYAPGRGAKREISVWVWYPGAPEVGAQPGAYLPSGWAAIGPAWGFAAERVRAHAVPEAPVAADERRYPVLVFSPAGFPPHLFAATIEEVVSHGYVVAGVNHTYETMPLSAFADGRTVPANPAATGGAWEPPTGPFEEDLRRRAAVVASKAVDLRFAVDQLGRLNAGTNLLAGRLDLARLGAVGFSLGGAAAVEFCRGDGRCAAVVNLDGGLWTDDPPAAVDRPVLLLTAEHPELIGPCEAFVRGGLFPSEDYCAAFRANAVGGWQALFAGGQPGYAAQVRGAQHVSFMDFPLLPVRDGAPLKGAIAAAAIDPRRMHRVVCDELLAFFGKHLRGEPAPLLDGPSPAHPEVVVGAPEVLFAEFGGEGENRPGSA